MISCKNRRLKVYEVPDEIQPYISTFLIEANKRGKHLVIDDIVIQYRSDIITKGIHAAGLCRKRFGHTPIIYLDTTTSNWKASKMAKEQLIFHELGHCILGRGHKSDTLLNGNAASIMKPTGETLYGSKMSLFKREYYLDELFDPNTDPPAWAQVTEEYNTPHVVTDTIFDFDFSSYTLSDSLMELYPDSTVTLDSSVMKQWSIGANSVTSRTIDKGHLQLESFQTGTYFIPFRVNIPADSNFEIRIKMTLPEENKGAMTFYWGGSKIQNTFGLISNQNGFVSIGPLDEGVEYGKYGMPIKQEDYNEFLIRRIGPFYYIFINGQFYNNLSFTPFNGDLFGIGVSGPPSKIWVEQITVTSIDKN